MSEGTAAGPDRQQAPGRRVPDPGFPGDAGDADPGLAAALAAVSADPGRKPEVLAALHGARVLAPVTALTAPGADADVVLALLEDGSGSRALPVFSSLATLARWDPAARPVPVEGPRAAAVALAERATDLVLDVAGPVPVTLGEREVRALLRPVAPVPAYADDELATVLRTVFSAEPRVEAAWIGPAAGVDARISLVLTGGQDPAEVAGSVADRLAALGRASVLGLDLAVVPPGRTPADADRPLRP